MSCLGVPFLQIHIGNTLFNKFKMLIGVIKSTGWTFENYLNNTSLGRHPCWCNRLPDTDRKLLWFGFDIVLQHVHTSQQGPFFLRYFLLISISYEVGISMWLQHIFTERRNHEIRGRACLLTCLNLLDRPKVYIFPKL